MRRTKAATALTAAGVLLAIVGWAAPAGPARIREKDVVLRDEPDGARRGSLLEGTRVERLEQEGDWARVRVEGWVRADALDEAVERASAAAAAGAAAVLPLQEATPRIKRLVNEGFGTFYSLEHDPDLARLTLRLRIAPMAPDALRRIQMDIQTELLRALVGKLEFTQVRVESNRADGTGRVGAEIAETGVTDLQRLAPTDTAGWRRATRISHDGGGTWDP